jgi:MoaA/NifB/PqqE/SkfB family radical SAM enzyme
MSKIKSKLFISNWINNNKNILAVYSRLKKELPREYRKKFYNIWILNHIGARKRLSGKKNKDYSPLTLKISPTMRCNLSCLGCFATDYPVESDMSFVHLCKIVEEAKNTGIPSVGIIGGEPLLLPNIFDLFIKFKNIGFYLVTNGTKITDTVVEELTRLPNVITIFSIDGFEEVNDYLRGKGVFQRIMNSMDMMKSKGLAFGFSTSVHQKSKADVLSEQFIDLMIKKGCIVGAFLPYIPVGKTPQYDLICSEEEILEYYRILERHAQTKPILILKEGWSDSSFLNSGCAAGDTMHITEKGEAEPCNGIEFFVDNTNQSTVEEIFNSGFFREIRRLNNQSIKKCITLTKPEAILEIVEKYNAKPTHEFALKHLKEYVNIKKSIGLNKSVYS